MGPSKEGQVTGKTRIREGLFGQGVLQVEYYAKSLFGNRLIKAWKDCGRGDFLPLLQSQFKNK